MSRVLAVATVLLLLASVPLASHVPGGHYGPSGPSALEGRSVFLLHGSLAGLTPGDGLLVIAPARAYDERELARLRDHLDSGGRILVAGATPAARSLVAGLDVGIEIGPSVVSPVAVDEAPVAFSTGRLPLDDVSLLRPEAVLGTAEPLLVTSHFAWLDADGDGRPDLEERQGAYAVAALAARGAGAVVVAPRALLERQGGDVLLDWLQQEEDGRILVDEAHRAPLDPFGVASWLAGEQAASMAALWGLLVLATAAWVVRLRLSPPRRRRVQRPDDAFTRRVLEELP